MPAPDLQGVKATRQARQPEFCLSLAKVVSIPNAETGQLSRAFHHSLWDIPPHVDASIYKMEIKKFTYMSSVQLLILPQSPPKD